MNNRIPGRWLLVALAIAGLALAAPAVTAHDDASTSTNETSTRDAPSDGSGVDPTGWMADRMADHLGPETAEPMWFHGSGPTDESSRHVTDEEDDHNRATGGMHGSGHGCH